MMKIALFASGSGTNVENIVNYFDLNLPISFEVSLDSDELLQDSLTNCSDVFCLIVWNLNIEFFFELHDKLNSV